MQVKVLALTDMHQEEPLLQIRLINFLLVVMVMQQMLVMLYQQHITLQVKVQMHLVIFQEDILSLMEATLFKSFHLLQMAIQQM